MRLTRRGWWIVGIVAWTFLPLLQVVERALWLTYRDMPIHWGRLLSFSLADWYACGLFLPVLIFATQRWPIDRRHLATRVPLHLGLLLGISVAKIALFQKVRVWLPMVDELPLGEMLAGGTIGEMIAFASVAGVLHAHEFHQRYRDREALSLQLQARLSDAQLRALRAQLNPHFLFNTLNAATALVHRDPDAADAMLTRLGELLRLTLRADPAHETSLRDELDILERYLSIMRIRFADRVTVRCVIDESVGDALVPSFILQPIVENAFEHGIGRLQRQGSIDIAARASGESLLLTVRDDGPGLAEETQRLGVGLANTRQRLTELYGEAGALTLRRGDGGGTVVEVQVPLRLTQRAA